MPSSASSYFKQALSKFHSGDVKGGLVDLEEALRLDPSRWEFYWTRGAFYYRSRAYTSAEADFTSAIERCPDVRQAGKIYQRRMFCFGRHERYDSLIQDATWLIDNGFNDGSVYLWRGWGYHKLGDTDRAIEDYSQAIDLIDDRTYMRHCLAILYIRSQRYVEALDDLNTAISFCLQTDQSHATFAYQMRAIAYYYMGEFEKSLEDYTRSQRSGIDPYPNVETYVMLIKNRIQHHFSGMPSRPHDKFVLKHLEEYGEV